MPAFALPLIIEPDPDDPGCATVFVDGCVDGRDTRFILDTGAPRTQVPAPGDADLTQLTSEASSGVFATDEHRITDIERLTLGELDIDGLSVSVSAAGASSLSLLGMDVLGRFRCTFDFADGRLLLETDASSQEDQELILGSRGHVYVRLELDGALTNACWDSGAGITLVDPDFASAHPSLFSEQRSSVGSDATGTSRETPTFTMAGPTIAGHRFHSHPVALVDLPRPTKPGDPPIDLILGYPTLTQAVWIMDFPARRWALRP